VEVEVEMVFILQEMQVVEVVVVGEIMRQEHQAQLVV